MTSYIRLRLCCIISALCSLCHYSSSALTITYYAAKAIPAAVQTLLCHSAARSAPPGAASLAVTPRTVGAGWRRASAGECATLLDIAEEIGYTHARRRHHTEPENKGREAMAHDVHRRDFLQALGLTVGAAAL